MNEGLVRGLSCDWPALPQRVRTCGSHDVSTQRYDDGSHWRDACGKIMYQCSSIVRMRGP